MMMTSSMRLASENIERPPFPRFLPKPERKKEKNFSIISAHLITFTRALTDHSIVGHSPVTHSQTVSAVVHHPRHPIATITLLRARHLTPLVIARLHWWTLPFDGNFLVLSGTSVEHIDNSPRERY